MSIKVGEVIAIQGIKITLKIFDASNKDTLFYNGERFKGVSIREHITIQRGFRDIICTIEGEYLDERNFESDGSKISYIRKVEAKPIGYFENGSFHEGIKFLPMIKDTAFLLKENKVSEIFSKARDNTFIVGSMLKEDIPISLPWEKLFNSHLGIFGNTGSGKSNTLAKIYSVLFNKKLPKIKGKSEFVIIDFNGEYTGEQLTSSDDKEVIQLNTQSQEGKDFFSLTSNQFWDSETLSILFQATTNTQRPFLSRVISRREPYKNSSKSFPNYIKKTFEIVFTAAAPKSETLDLLRIIASKLKAYSIINLLKNILWHRKSEVFHTITDDQTIYFNSDGDSYKKYLKEEVNQIDTVDIDEFDEFVIRMYIQLTVDLVNGSVQFDHIQPLLKRAEASFLHLKKVVKIINNPPKRKTLTVISLRKCNQEIKKVLPLLIAKYFYNEHKNNIIDHPPDKTMHLIIDEAHNILSQQSSSEQESWKDYRLQLFEEIIKEGRKFGMFLTLSSQRPADISPTIISQVHNFFIHRLVNERDLYLLENTLSTLDSLSRSLIPNLSKGSCIITGTSFDLPILIQIEQLPEGNRPDSEDVDLESLWK